MRIGVDATSWSNKRGFGRFARNAVTRLVELDRDATYVLYIDEQSAGGAALPEGAEVSRFQLQRTPSEAASAGSRRPPGHPPRQSLQGRRRRLAAFPLPPGHPHF